MSGEDEIPLFPKRGGPEYVRWLAKWDTFVLGKGLGPIHRMATDPAKKLISLDEVLFWQLLQQEWLLPHQVLLLRLQRGWQLL